MICNTCNKEKPAKTFTHSNMDSNECRNCARIRRASPSYKAEKLAQKEKSDKLSKDIYKYYMSTGAMYDEIASKFNTSTETVRVSIKKHFKTI